MMTVRNTGYALFGTQIGSSTLASLRNRVFVASEAGTRCLLGPSQVQVRFRNRVGAYAAEMAIA